jgi:hypothetical protein
MADGPSPFQPSKKQKTGSTATDFASSSRPPKTRKQHRLASNGVSTQNRFEILSDDSDSSIAEVEMNSRQSSPKRRKPKTVDNSKEASVKLPKPIVVVNTTFDALKKVIAEITLTKPPLIRKRRGSDFEILAKNHDDKKVILNRLKDSTKHVSHYTFTESKDRRKLVVLHGHHEIDVVELESKLKAVELPVTMVTKINKSTQDPLYLISLEKGPISIRDLNENYNVIDFLKVSWKKYLPKNRRPTQCRRCQRFGHAANNCELPYRCVKCLLTHKPGECARKTLDGLPSCVNCNIEGHTSSSTDCPAYKSYLEKISKRKNQQQRSQREQQHHKIQQPREFPATRFDWNTKLNIPFAASQPPTCTSQPQIVNQYREYRPELRNSVAQSLPMSQNPLSQLQALQAEFNSDPEIQEAVELFASFVSELKSARTKLERFNIILKFSGLAAVSTSASP